MKAAATGHLPPVLWSALGFDPRTGALNAASFDGDVHLHAGTLTAGEMTGWLSRQIRLGVELVAVPTRPTPSPDPGPEADLLVPLDEWSMALGIRPSQTAGTIAAISKRLSDIFEQLCALDPAVLRQALAQMTYRESGDYRLVANALAHCQTDVAVQTVPMELMFLSNRPKPERLRKRHDRQPVNPKAASMMFAARGPVAEHYRAWELRPQQTALAEAVARTLVDGGELIAEAGTGTGKSLAYLVPSLIHAIGTGEQVVVATNTRILQDQLATKDAPIAIDAVRSAIPDSEPVVRVLKGRGNYLCLRRWFTEAQHPAFNPDQDQSAFRGKATIWLSVTETGERSELSLDREGNRQFDRVSAEGEACDASRCQFQQRNQCFLYRARRNADAAHVVITNHALLLTDVVQGGESLPEARHLIIDEAHHLEDQATTSFQTAISQRIVGTALNGLASDGRRGGPPGLLVEIDSFFGSAAMNVTPQDQRNAVRQAVGAATRAVDRVRTGMVTLFGGLAQLVGEFSEPSREYAARTRLTEAVRRSAQWEGVEQGWDALNLAMADLTSELAQLQAALPEAPALDIPAGDVSDDISLRLEELENRLGSERHVVGELAALLHEAIHNPRSHNVYWLESRQLDSQSTTLFAAPLHLAEYLRTNLYSRLDTLVLTSATMTTGGSTAYVRNRLGLPDADEFHVASPFDYEKNALLILPSDVPEPNVPTFDAAAHQAIYETAVAAEGRTLVLFTSIAAMNSARLRLADALAEARLTLVTQHEDGSAEQLAERLRTFDRTVVFGAGAFWEGVDVSGPALSALVIAKLPFAVPTDPVVAARSESFDNPFMDYSLPQATLKVRQGFGRLIRSSTDRGVCVLLDRRVTSKRYGRLILDTLPKTRRDYGTISQIGMTIAAFLGETRQ